MLRGTTIHSRRYLLTAYLAALTSAVAVGCFRDDGTLGFPCSQDASCGAGQMCVEQRCLPPGHCAANGDPCAGGEFCDPCTLENGGCNPEGSCIDPCGDGIEDEDEECDDGNRKSGDDCSSSCRLEVCGNGIRDPDEECDAGAGADDPLCSDDCRALPVCGDGVTELGEECDDGNVADFDGCTSACTLPVCGDGVPQSNELCDDGNRLHGDGCNGGCQTETARATTLPSGLQYQTWVVLESGGLRWWGVRDLDNPGDCIARDACIGDDEVPASEPEVVLDADAVQVAAGMWHVCALLETNGVRCWGGRSDTSGAIFGQGSKTADVPLGSGTIEQLEAGHSHTCVRFDNGEVTCWGVNGDGQLGYGHTQAIGDDEPPSEVGPVPMGGEPALEITVGDDHSCALLEEGRIRCWGSDGNGQLGYGAGSQAGMSPAELGDVPVGAWVTDVSAGYDHTCVVTEPGGVRCWGGNFNGQLGTGNCQMVGEDWECEDEHDAGTVEDIDFGDERQAREVHAGYYITCVVFLDDTLRCWGLHEGPLGVPTSENWQGKYPFPAQVPDIDVGSEILELGMYRYRVCARVPDAGSGIRCWGRNVNGRIGYGFESQEWPGHLSPAEHAEAIGALPI